MYLLRIEYTAASEAIETVRPAHRAWLAELLARGLVLVGGPLDDHTGGIAVLLHDSREALDRDLAGDPYIGSGVAQHRIEAFVSTMRHPALESIG